MSFTGSCRVDVYVPFTRSVVDYVSNGSSIIQAMWIHAAAEFTVYVIIDPSVVVVLCILKCKRSTVISIE